MTKTQKPCAACGKPLEEIDFNRDYFMHLCNTQGCPMRRQPQGSRYKYPESEAELRGVLR